MNIRDELTPTILKIKDLAETFRRPGRRPPDPESLFHLLNGLADEVEYVLNLNAGVRTAPADRMPKYAGMVSTETKAAA